MMATRTLPFCPLLIVALIPSTLVVTACLRDQSVISSTLFRNGSPIFARCALHRLASGTTIAMTTDKPIRVAIIGLGFGAEFIPIYQSYPGAEVTAICRRSQKDLDECGDRWKIAKRYTDFAQVLNDP